MFNRTTLLMLALLAAVPAIAHRQNACPTPCPCPCGNAIGELAGIRGTIEFIRFENQEETKPNEFRPVFKSEEGCGFEWVETLVCRTPAKMVNPPWGNKTLCKTVEPTGECDPKAPCGIYCSRPLTPPIECTTDNDCDFDTLGLTSSACVAGKCTFSCDGGVNDLVCAFGGPTCDLNTCIDSNGNKISCKGNGEETCECPAPCPEGMCCENGECPVTCPLFTDAFDYAATTRIRFCSPWCPDTLPSIITQLQLRSTPFTGDPLACTNPFPANIFLAKTDSGDEPVAAFFTPNTPLITAITETQFEFFNAITIFAKDTVVGGNDVSAETNADNAFRALFNGNKNGVGGPGEPIKLNFAAFGSPLSCSH